MGTLFANEPILPKPFAFLSSAERNFFSCFIRNIMTLQNLGDTSPQNHLTKVAMCQKLNSETTCFRFPPVFKIPVYRLYKHLRLLDAPNFDSSRAVLGCRPEPGSVFSMR